jgi:hypothetical protein
MTVSSFHKLPIKFGGLKTRKLKSILEVLKNMSIGELNRKRN